MKTVHVDLDVRSYDILIDENLTESIQKFFQAQNFTRKAFIISDSNVINLHGGQFSQMLMDSGFETALFEIPAGEPSKSLSQAEKIYTSLIELKHDRKSPIIALGGGVVGDLAGFVASTYLRGVPFIQIPTTLLAQVDSSVGGKVAVNHRLGKNLIGAFYQPKAVFIDLNFIKTLPEREIRAGFAEVIKYGIIKDAEFFDGLANDEEINIENVIARSCEIKADVVNKDEKESGLRRILNFGHTVAHAVEEETQYQVFVHGEAVAIGMVAATRISKLLGNIDDEVETKIINVIEKFGLPTSTQQTCDAENIYQALFRDKKVSDGKINWVVIDSIGNVSVNNQVSENIVRDAIDFII